MKKLWIDFEFNGTSDPILNLVCASAQAEGRPVVNFWLHNAKEAQEELASHLYEMRNDYVIMAFGAVAEARSFLALGLDPLDFKWVDLHIEYRMIINHNMKLMYGKQLIDGRKVRTFRPALYEDKKTNNQMPHFSYAAAVYKLLDVELDTQHKTKMRDLIISAPDEFGHEDKMAIQKYCESDIKFLPPLWKEIQNWLVNKKIYGRSGLILPSERGNLKEEIYKRGEYAARTAIMEGHGYPIDYEATKHFSGSVQYILNDLAADINKQFPDLNLFEWKSRTERKYKKIERNWRAWVNSTGLDWVQTKGTDRSAPQHSLALEAFAKHFHFRHSYPQGNVGAQILRYLKTKQSLNGFTPGGKKNFWDSVGSDKRVRPYMGIYRAQSSRSQPAATGFIPLKAAWMRALIVPPQGKAIISEDYKSEEFLIAALKSGDKNMLEAYMSGDVYLYFAKLAGEVPWDGVKKDYKEIREKFKHTTLGIQYGIGNKGLAEKLTIDCGRPFTQEEAGELRIMFDTSFPKYGEYVEETWQKYCGQGGAKIPVRLPCGWHMFNDNLNKRSVSNCPTQGTGGSVMRQAVANAQDAGLTVIYTLHDALYVECDSDKVGRSAKLLANAMQGAFQFCLGTDFEVGLDANTWSLDFEDDQEIKDFEGKVQKIYVDERGIEEYKKFSQYFSKDESLEIL